jgi:hypothetical protein
MANDLDALRAAIRQDADRTRITDRCPPSETLWSAARGDLPPDALAPLLDHVSTCAACSEAWQLAVEVTRDLGKEVESDAPPLAPARRRWLRWSALAAAAAVLAIAAVVLPRYLARPPESSGEVYRTEATPAIRPLLSEGQPAAKDHLLLRWTPAGEGARYAVEIATEDLSVVDRGENLTTNEYLVPERALDRLPSGTRLVWQVQATMPNGRTTRSAAFIISLQ